MLVNDKDYTCKTLEDTLDSLLFDKKKISEMTENLKKAAVYDFGERVFDCIMSYLDKK